MLQLAILLRVSLAALVLTGSMLGAMAVDSIEQCRGFAQQAVDLQATNMRLKCGLAGPDWTGNFQENFGYCRRAQSSSVDQIVHRRTVAINRCENVCPDYARRAENDVRIAGENLCLHPALPGVLQGLTGPADRWVAGYDAHFRFCMSGASDATIIHERDTRAFEAAKCARCKTYAVRSHEQAKANKENACGYEDPGMITWGTELSHHHKHCMASLRDGTSFISDQISHRADRLQFCEPGKAVFCKRHAGYAVLQRQALAGAGKLGECGRPENRWTAYRQAHYDGCMQQRSEVAMAEHEARNDTLRTCGGMTDPGTPPMIPLAAGAQCRFGVEMRTR